MHRIIKTFAVVVLVATVSAGQASAQDNVLGGALIGGGLGAIIGGAATGKAGGAVAGGVIGAAAGAMLGAQLEPRRGGFFWYRGRCYRRVSNGDYYRVARRHCY